MAWLSAQGGTWEIKPEHVTVYKEEPVKEKMKGFFCISRSHSALSVSNIYHYQVTYSIFFFGYKAHFIIGGTFKHYCMKLAKRNFLLNTNSILGYKTQPSQLQDFSSLRSLLTVHYFTFIYLLY